MSVTNAASKIRVDLVKNSYGDALNDMIINIPESISDFSFSTTNVLDLDQSMNLQVRLTNFGNGSVLLQDVHVLIRKLD